MENNLLLQIFLTLYFGVTPNMSAKEGANIFTSLLIFSTVVEVSGLSTSAWASASELYSIPVYTCLSVVSVFTL